MTGGIDLKLGRENAERSTEVHNVLDAFAPEHDLIVPPRHATRAPGTRKVQFIFEQGALPLPPVKKARGIPWLALTVLALLGAAAFGAYLYYPNRLLDLDTIAVWASRLASRSTAPSDTAITTPATAPSEARPTDPTLTDPLLTAPESAIAIRPDRTVDTRSNRSEASVSEIAQPAAARPAGTGTSGLLISAARNVSGVWRLDTQIEASDSSFQSLNVHYEMTLKQDGDRLAGAGTKVSETAQTPVTVTGTIAGDRVTLNFIESGTQPEARTKFVLLVDEAGSLRGRFSSSAAPTSGHAEAHRVSAQ